MTNVQITRDDVDGHATITASARTRFGRLALVHREGRRLVASVDGRILRRVPAGFAPLVAALDREHG